MTLGANKEIPEGKNSIDKSTKGCERGLDFHVQYLLTFKLKNDYTLNF